MKSKLGSIIRILLGIAVLFLTVQCNKEEEASGVDKELLDMAMETSGFTWYKNSDDLLNKSSGSAHDYPYLRTRYNSIASSQLDENGKILEGAVFPEGSLVVKELYSSSSSLDRYAILFKQSDNEYADAQGWVWGYINADGTVAESATKKGVSCISCHSQSGSIDYMLMNKYFP